MKRITFILLAILLLTMPQWARIAPATATAMGEGLTERREEEANCLFFTETVQGEGSFSVCDDQEANFRSAFEGWGLQKIGYPISQRYVHDGFVTQAFQKAIMQWQAESGTVALVNIFDDLHNAGFDDTLLSVRQTPDQLPAGWDGDIPFDEVVEKRQALLEKRPALQETYFASSDPLTFYGLPTSEVEDMDNHYAIRLQRAVLQEWKEEVSWAKEGEVTIANGGDIAKELGALPAEALMPIPAPSEVMIGEAYIDEVEILIMESSPVQISVVLRGHLADGCTALHEITQINGEDNTIMLNVTTIRPFREACTLALVPFEETFSLDLTELTPGTYTIDANGTTATLKLTADMLGQ